MAKQFKSTDIVNTASGIIHNKIVLYFVFFIALLNLFFSAVKHDYLFCALFILIGFVAAFFNKNMTVILVCTIAISNILRVLIRDESKFEGMKEEIDFDSISKNLNVENKVSVASESEKVAAEPTSAKASMPDTSDKSNTSDNNAKKKMVDTLKNEAQDLLEVQQKIIKGFEKIEPEMTRAEKLINQINGTAKQIQAFQGMSN